MREILFKAKRVDSQEWVEGLFCKWRFSGKSLFTPCIQTIKEWDSGDYLDFIEVDPATVCQFTGLIDKNDKRIFEGDVIEKVGPNLNEVYYCHPDEHKIGQKYVVFSLASGFTLIKIERVLPVKTHSLDTPNIVGNINNYNFWNGSSSACKVLGNIHDMKEGEV